MESVATEQQQQRVPIDDSGDDWSDWPWKNVDFSVHTRMPTFVVCEALFLALFSMVCLHAVLLSSFGRGKNKDHLALLCASLVGGIGNDVFFVWLPVVDNFWHSQATVMVTPRFPLYVAFLYVSFLYIPTALVWRLDLRSKPFFVEPAVVALCAVAFYAPFDAVGARFLWWTWHDSDTTLTERLLGVPVASTMWVATYSASFAFLVRKSLPTTTTKTATTTETTETTETTTIAKLALDFARVQAVVFCFSVPLMMVAMMVVQCSVGRSLPPPPPPTAPMLLLLLSVCFSVAVIQLLLPKSKSSNKWQQGGTTTASSTTTTTTASPEKTTTKTAAPTNNNNAGGVAATGKALLVVAFLLHHATLAGVAVLGNPAAHRSVGAHQTYGNDCEAEDIDYSGQVRRRYICSDEIGGWERAFSFCDVPNNGSSWYAICGREKPPGWIVRTIFVVVAGTLVLGSVAVAASFSSSVLSSHGNSSKKER